MNFEKAAEFNAARRRGLSPESAAAFCGLRELALESEDARHRGDVVPPEPGEPDANMGTASLARSSDGWARGARLPRARNDTEP